MPPERFELWRLAEVFGAVCHRAIRPATTHLVSLRPDTDKVFQAVEAGILVVRPEWLVACFRHWTALPVAPFLLHALPTPAEASAKMDEQRASAARVRIHSDVLDQMNEELAELEGEAEDGDDLDDLGELDGPEDGEGRGEDNVHAQSEDEEQSQSRSHAASGLDSHPESSADTDEHGLRERQSKRRRRGAESDSSAACSDDEFALELERDLL